MREISFRAWDKKEQVMLYYIEYAYDGLSGNVKYSDGSDAEYEEDCFADFLDNDKYIVMQFTGCKDMYNTPIYEGDVVYNHYKYSHGHACVVFKEEGAYYLSGEDLSTGGDMFLANYNVECETLGNLYENQYLKEKLK